MNKGKEKLSHKAYDVLEFFMKKLDYMRFDSCSISDKVTIDVSQYLGDRKTWHHMAYNCDFWVKGNGLRKDDNSGFFLNGKQKEI